jgi:type 1 glutamine amidotransferase
VLDAAPPPPPVQRSPSVLVFTRTEGFRHDAIAGAVRALRAGGLRVTRTEEPARLTLRALRRHDALVFLLTTGDVLDPPQERAVERYVRGGGGWVGVHSAADTEYDWPFYGTLLAGAWFRGHPAVQPATIRVRSRDPSTAHLPSRWRRTDEWYAFRVRPRRPARVLLALDEASYAPGEHGMGGDHPIAWSRRVGRGRAWYTGLGHTRESYRERAFRRHLLGGIRWASGGAR